MNKLKKLFSPSTLAATIATGMLLHATVALAQQYCLSSCAIFTQSGCYPNQPCPTPSGYYYCCPSGDNCGYYYRADNCAWGYAGFCICPD